ncbi:MAG: hypothetical protein HFF01_02620 [Erysipelotrichaceae bacterium]|nr:hypothetical protein [Erysipelotrichaceae bacterium]MCI9312526.1 hypothetical protein [Erysipelotrichaceae bacterium]MCI9523932.1 hypothetical protein [Erysipelotrichaceae bacterium]
MANNQNLKPFTKENAAEMGRKGGIASGKTRRKLMMLKIMHEVIMESGEKGEKFLDEVWKKRNDLL